jgi:hypothetical protein
LDPLSFCSCTIIPFIISYQKEQGVFGFSVAAFSLASLFLSSLHFASWCIFLSSLSIIFLTSAKTIEELKVVVHTAISSFRGEYISFLGV